MSVAAFMRHLIDAGMPLDMVLISVEAFEKHPPEMLPASGDLTPRQERNRRYYEARKERLKASENRLNSSEASELRQVETEGSPPLPLSPQTPLSPAPPPENITTHARKPSEPACGFDAFWSRYPLKKSKLAAAKAYPKALRKLDHATLVRHLDYQIRCGVWDGQYGPHASTWLNGERWNDDCQPRRFAGMAGQPAPGYRGRQDTSLAEIAARRQREREQGVEVPGGEAPVSGDDHGWAEGAIDVEPIRRAGEG